jgi:hypothetical protein
MFFMYQSGVLKVTDEKRPDPLVRGADPDLHQNVTDPEHWKRCVFFTEDLSSDTDVPELQCIHCGSAFCMEMNCLATVPGAC